MKLMTRRRSSPLAAKYRQGFWFMDEVSGGPTRFDLCRPDLYGNLTNLSRGRPRRGDFVGGPENGDRK